MHWVWTSRMMHDMTMMHYVMLLVMHHFTMMSDRVMGLGHRGGCHGKQNDNQ
ncbi:MAG TPA: hypothetical protein VL727_26660 [Puia sp.]|jgi:hypothetical protein|nr:hypothetical protein [Puia sp.]